MMPYNWRITESLLGLFVRLLLCVHGSQPITVRVRVIRGGACARAFQIGQCTSSLNISFLNPCLTYFLQHTSKGEARPWRQATATVPAPFGARRRPAACPHYPPGPQGAARSPSAATAWTRRRSRAVPTAGGRCEAVRECVGLPAHPPSSRSAARVMTPPWSGCGWWCRGSGIPLRGMMWSAGGAEPEVCVDICCNSASREEWVVT